MIDFLRAKATRTRVSEGIYIAFNGLLPIAVFFLVRSFEPPYLAVLLVLLSKWRILALRPRYWWAHLKTNMVDILVGLSAVILMYLATNDEVILQVLIAGAYAAWLLFVKPLSSNRGVMLQAGIAQFVGLTALFHMYLLPELLVLLTCWLIGYVVARHAISNYDERHVELLAALWGLFVAELGWLAWRWTVVYDFSLPLMIPQIALIMLVIGFCASRMYHAHKNGTLNKSTLRGTVLFGVALLAVILIFTKWDETI